jgi:ribosomal protein S18 acetylase RimI-like enzyme
MSVELRCFEPADYPAASALWQSTAGVGLSAADDEGPILRFLQRNPRMSFVAIDSGRLVGTILCGHDGRRGLIHHLVSAPAHRRRGVARRLLDAAMQALRGAGIDKCHAMVFRSNADGQAFWQAVIATKREELVLFSVFTHGGTD